MYKYFGSYGKFEQMKKPIAFVLAVLLLVACEKTITFKLDESAPRLVVDASIESGQPPLVLLSNSLNYFSAISPAILLGSFVHDATITLSNGTKTQVLKEYSYKTAANIEIFFYSIDSANLANTFNGELNKTYSLQIKLGDKQYSLLPPFQD
jgi:hypothetical protein